ncbi:YgaP family membrane protein [Roseibium aggregatum]|uniref:DUF2892 domain-containing protein n=1 Tax=Roseibium aggregatum TaxID=187304 RepID=A0A939EEC3_9HYPH|nr:YgaP-like transmembrane domain [Roseibium aggregatum]MBN9670255.1 DUF2892 domain-containing protein [Roseibium aggregatum]
MTTNVGTLDRILRAALGLALLYLAFLSGIQFFAGPLSKFGATVIGIVMFVTSVTRLCPLYAIFGVKTCREC